jgi:hypothetical protein
MGAPGGARTGGAAADGEEVAPETEGGGGRAGGDSLELSPEAKRMLEALKARDKQVRAHEAAHLAAGAGITKGGATYTMQRGPDGNSYAIGGEVPIDAGEVPGDPKATLAKAQQIAAAALAPADPSPQDRAVAASARQMAAQASMEMARGAGGAGETGETRETEEAEEAEEAEGAKDVEVANGAGGASGAAEAEIVEAAKIAKIIGSAATGNGRAEGAEATDTALRPTGPVGADAGSAADRLNGADGRDGRRRAGAAQDRRTAQAQDRDDGRGAPTMTARGRQVAETYVAIERMTLAANQAARAYQAVA